MLLETSLHRGGSPYDEEEEVSLLNNTGPVGGAGAGAGAGSSSKEPEIHQERQSYKRIGLVFSVVCIISPLVLFVIWGGTRSNGGASNSLGNRNSTLQVVDKLQIGTWNIGAVNWNNNPWEYWLTYAEEPAYETLMVGVETFLENPADRDVAVDQVFTRATR